jgi:hypothetical protein
MSPAAPPPEGGLTTIELVELSDLAWTIVDPDGEHEQLEQAWIAALPNDWQQPADTQVLSTRLAETVRALRPFGQTPLPEIVSAAVLYLAAHVERRRVEEAVIGEALHERYGAEMPVEIAGWLARRPTPALSARRHGARARRRHFHTRPPAAPELRYD